MKEPVERSKGRLMAWHIMHACLICKHQALSRCCASGFSALAPHWALQHVDEIVCSYVGSYKSSLWLGQLPPGLLILRAR